MNGLFIYGWAEVTQMGYFVCPTTNLTLIAIVCRNIFWKLRKPG
jgi:hypothetical protein